MPREPWFTRFSLTARNAAGAPFRRRCKRPRYAAREQIQEQAEKPRTQQHRAVRPLSQCPQARGQREGNISICSFERGWFWFIPLADGTTSVGAVCWAYYLKARDKPLKEYFFDTIAMCPELNDRLRNATLVDDAVHATGNFAYVSTHATGDRYLMLGDAFTFIDPMFSSGVFLAMQSAFDGAEVVATALDRPAELPAARRALEKRMRAGRATIRGSSTGSRTRRSATCSCTRRTSST